MKLRIQKLHPAARVPEYATEDLLRRARRATEGEHQQDYDVEALRRMVSSLVDALESAEPQQKPLTNAQIDEEWFHVYDLNISSADKARIFARAIEAAHNIG